MSQLLGVFKEHLVFGLSYICFQWNLQFFECIVREQEDNLKRIKEKFKDKNLGEDAEHDG